MNFDVIFGATFIGLTGLILALRTKCSLLILALCAGFVLRSTLQENIVTVGDKISISPPAVSVAQILQIVAVLLPAVIVALRFYKSERGLGLLQQLAPALGSVGLLCVFIAPILQRSGVADTLDASVLWGLFLDYRVWIIIFAISVSLIGIMVEGHGGPKRGRPKKKD